MEINNIRLDSGQTTKETAEKLLQLANAAKPQPTDVTAAVSAAQTQTAASTVDLLKDLLISYGFPINETNLNLAETLLQNDIPLDKSSFLKLNQALKLFNINAQEISAAAGTPDSASNAAPFANADNVSNMDKAVFMLKNQFQLTTNMVNRLNSFLGENSTLSQGLKLLGESLANMADSPAKQLIMDILLGESAVTTGIQEKAATSGLFSTEELLFPQTSVSDSQSPIQTSAQSPTDGKAYLPPHLSEALKDLAPKQKQELMALIEKGELNPETFEKITGSRVIIAQKEITDIAKTFFPDNSEILDKLEKSISRSGQKEISIADKVLDKFSLKPLDLNKENVENLLTELKSRISEALKAVETTGTKNNEIGKALTNINQNLEFLSELKTCIYIPLPINTALGHTEGKLFVFKDKNKSKSSKSISALISLNTVNLGRIEAYVQKYENCLDLQFRLENTDVSKIIKAAFPQLVTLLDDTGLTFTGFHIVPLENPFTIINEEPVAKATTYYISSSAFDQKA